MNVRSLIVALLLTCLPVPAVAETARHITISVDQSGAGEGGKNIAFEVRDNFRRSALFVLNEDGTNVGYHVHIGTVEGDPPINGLTAYSVVVTVAPLRVKPVAEDYLTQFAGYCGTSVTASCAQRIYASVARYIEDDSNATNAALRAAFPPK
jgi:hypothetical protein